MQKQIETLAYDIYDILTNPHEWDAAKAEKLGHNIAETILSKLSQKESGGLRMSNLGGSCNKELWYGANAPELGETLRPNVRLKFLIGDIIEEVMLFLAEEAGHSVTGRQDTLELFGVKGHRDAVIDGVTVDVKSASTFSMKKFAEGLKPETDSFGYLTQLAAYRDADPSDAVDKTKSAFLAVDKTLGNIVLDVHTKKKDVDWETLIKDKRAVLQSNKPPERPFNDEEYGKSGNRKLGTKCSYCRFKKACWPGLRTFLYSSGPVHLTQVVREPDVPELSNSNQELGE